MVVVIAFCVLNWVLLKKDDTERPKANKPFETMVVESILRALTPVMKHPSKNYPDAAPDLEASREYPLEVEPWMISLEAFSKPDGEEELTVEAWMLSLASWRAD
jgi:hypothetical protein